MRGFMSVYAGLWQSLEAVVRAVGDEDAGLVGPGAFLSATPI